MAFVHENAFNDAFDWDGYVYPRAKDEDGYDSELDSLKNYDKTEKKQYEMFVWLKRKLSQKVSGEGLSWIRCSLGQEDAIEKAKNLLCYLQERVKVSEMRNRIIKFLQSWIHNPGINKRLLQERTAAVQAAEILFSYLHDTIRHDRFYDFVHLHDERGADLKKFITKVTKTAKSEGMKIDQGKRSLGMLNNVKLPEVITSVQRLILYLDQRMEASEGKNRFENLKNGLSLWISNALSQIMSHLVYKTSINIDLNQKLWYSALELTIYLGKYKSKIQSRMGDRLYSDFTRELKNLKKSLGSKKHLHGGHLSPHINFALFITKKIKEIKRTGPFEEVNDLKILNALEQAESLGLKVPELANILQKSALDACLLFKKYFDMYLRWCRKKELKSSEAPLEYISRLNKILSIYIGVFSKCKIDAGYLSETRDARDEYLKARNYSKKLADGIYGDDEDVVRGSRDDDEDPSSSDSDVASESHDDSSYGDGSVASESHDDSSYGDGSVASESHDGSVARESYNDDDDDDDDDDEDFTRDIKRNVDEEVDASSDSSSDSSGDGDTEVHRKRGRSSHAGSAGSNGSHGSQQSFRRKAERRD